MFADPTEGKEDASLDQDEPVLWTKRGPNAKPWHPGEMGAPYVYKICLLGPCHAGKSSIAHRLVAHTFDPTYRASRQPAQLFWRHTEAATGRDIMMEIEDMPGVTPETSESGGARVGRAARVARAALARVSASRRASPPVRSLLARAQS